MAILGFQEIIDTPHTLTLQVYPASTGAEPPAVPSGKPKTPVNRTGPLPFDKHPGFDSSSAKPERMHFKSGAVVPQDYWPQVATLVPVLLER